MTIESPGSRQWELERWLNELTSRRARYSDPAELAERVSRRIQVSRSVRSQLYGVPDRVAVATLKRLVAMLDYRRPKAWRVEISLEDAALDQLLANSLPLEPERAPPLPAVAAAVDAVLAELDLDRPGKEAHLALFGKHVLLLSSPSGHFPDPPGEERRRKSFLNFLNYRGVQTRGPRSDGALRRENRHQERVRAILDDHGVTPEQAIGFCTQPDVFVGSKTLARAVTTGGYDLLGAVRAMLRAPSLRAIMGSTIHDRVEPVTPLLQEASLLIEGMYAQAQARTPMLLGGLLRFAAEHLQLAHPVEQAVEWLCDRPSRADRIGSLSRDLHPTDEVGRWMGATSLAQHYSSEGVSFAEVESELWALEEQSRGCDIHRMGVGTSFFGLAAEDPTVDVGEMWTRIRQRFHGRDCGSYDILFPVTASIDLMGTSAGAQYVATSPVVWGCVEELLDSPNPFAHVAGMTHIRALDGLGLSGHVPESTRSVAARLTRQVLPPG